MSETWTPDDPTLLPQHLSVPRSASALWWPSLRVIRVSSRIMERPASMRSLEAMLNEKGVDPSAFRWVCADTPYVVPPLAAAWSRTASTWAGPNRVKVWWALCTYRPAARTNDKVWTWRRAWIDKHRTSLVFDKGESPHITATMEETARGWARTDGFAYLPDIETGMRVTEAQLEAAREARAMKGGA